MNFYNLLSKSTRLQEGHNLNNMLHKRLKQIIRKHFATIFTFKRQQRRNIPKSWSKGL